LRLRTVELHHLRLRLVQPYSLSFRTVESFDVLMVKLGSDETKEWGEVVPLPGYSGISFEETSKAVRSLCRKIKDEQAEVGLKKAVSEADENPFAVSAVAPPLEKLTGSFGTEPCRMPLTGILSSDEEVGKKLSDITEDGFSVVKLKAHGVVDRDAELVKEVLSDCNLPVRVDANQAYSLEEATKLVERISEHSESDRIQVFEQPLPTDVWEKTKKLRDASSLPIGLDESIWSAHDAERATDCADVIKLKLAKHGSLKRTVRIAEAAFEGDLEVIIGNGVAGELSTLYESALWRECDLEKAGENNGYLKYSGSVMADPPRFDSGSLIPPANTSVDEKKVLGNSVENWRY
jgi:L-alanine-DL-glutamate epimerase-like enolase superfamily enzyme